MLQPSALTHSRPDQIAEVPQKYDENKELGVWVNKQRMEMKALREGKRSSLTPKKIEKLEEAGFIW